MLSEASLSATALSKDSGLTEHHTSSQLLCVTGLYECVYVYHLQKDIVKVAKIRKCQHSGNLFLCMCAVPRVINSWFIFRINTN